MGVGAVHSSCPLRKGYLGKGENGIWKDGCVCGSCDSKDALSERQPGGNQGGRARSFQGAVHPDPQLLQESNALLQQRCELRGVVRFQH